MKSGSKFKTLACGFVVAVLAFGNSVSVSAAANSSVETGAAQLPDANTQPRHKACTSLSKMAREYYSGDFSYDSLRALPGAQDITTSYAAAHNNRLYDALHTLMADMHGYYTTYSGFNPGSLAYYWASTDAVLSSNTYTMFYSDVMADTEGIKLNREHVWPKSHASFNTSNGGADLHHLRPSVDKLNMAKSDHAFGYIKDTYKLDFNSGEINGTECYYVSQKNDLFECKDDVKGDVARILLYVYCRWDQPNLYSDLTADLLPEQETGSTDNGKRVVESLDTLLQWCEEDPVDTWEMERNDLTEMIQGNRNAFIDYPELAWDLFEVEPPKGMSSPSHEGCEHHYSEVSRDEAECEADGQFVLRCDKCGNELHRRLAQTGHTDVNKDHICDYCEKPLIHPVVMKQASQLKDGDHVLLYYASGKSTLSPNVSVNNKLSPVSVNKGENGVQPPLDSTVFYVKAADENSFYLISQGKYLTSPPEGGGLFYADEPGEYSKWRSDPSDIENQVLLVNTAAKFNGIPQAIQYYSGSFTTYGKSDKSAFRFELYTTDGHLWDENGKHCLLCGEPSPGSGAILGDANLDGDVNINDVTTIQYYLAELIDSESICFEAADVDLSGELDIFDATTLQMYLADFELPYEIGKMRVSTLAAGVN